jgi:hypothetical protein
MEAELMALAEGGASTLVAAMATDAWSQAKALVLGLWRRHRPESASAVEQELDRAYDVLHGPQAVDSERERLRAEGRWQGRLEVLLAESPEAGRDLSEITERLGRLLAGSGSAAVHQSVRAGRDAYTAGRDLSVGVSRPHPDERPGPEARP